jgi:hypothetical protein
MSKVAPRVVHLTGLEPRETVMSGGDRGGQLGRLRSEPRQPELGRLQLGQPGRVVAREPGVVPHRGDFGVEPAQREGQLVGLGLGRRVRLRQLRDPRLEIGHRLGRRRDLAQPREPEGIVPGLADRAGPRVLRAGRRTLAGEPVARVEAPQSLVTVDPRDVVADDDRRPFDVTARPDGPAVAARVIDERDAERMSCPGREVARIRLRQRVPPQPADEVQWPTDVLLARERQQHDVFAALEVRRMRAGARVDDRMAVDGLHPWVVPAAAQVVALLVVGRGAEPRRPEVVALHGLEHDEALLPVRLVVVGTLERRAPVVHRVEEQVVEDHPAAFADDATVVGDRRIVGGDRVVLDRRCGRRPTGHAPPEEQRRDEAGVHQPGGESDAREPTRRVEPTVCRFGTPPAQLERAQRFLDESQELGFAGLRLIRRRGEAVQVQLADGHLDARVAKGRGGQEVAGLDVPAGRHREEQLAVREVQDRLVATQQLEIGRGAHPLIGSPRSDSRTSGWLR